jgi:hypothetical protein
MSWTLFLQIVILMVLGWIFGMTWIMERNKRDH